MEIIDNAFERALNYISTIGFADVFDILIVAYLIFRIVLFIKKTGSYNLARGLVIFLIALWLSEIFNLTMINFLLRKAVEIGAVAVLILFQPELRRLLETVGSRLSSGKSASSSEVESVILQTVMACSDLSQTKTGALIVFERSVLLSDIIANGTAINADVNSELLKNIFYNKAPLHDGAVVIRNNKISAASCVLPLTKSTNLSKDLGTRHRAALGMSENSDAVVIIVSEETGTISVAIDGMLKRHLDKSTLDTLLQQELVIDESDSEKGFFKSLKKLISVNADEKN